MVAVGPTFFSSAVGDGVQATAGAPVDSGIPVIGNMVAVKLDSTRVILAYQAGVDFKTKAVIVTDLGNGLVSFGTPVAISSGVGALTLLGMDVLNAAAGTFMCTYGVSSTVSKSRIFTVTGSVITATGTEDDVSNIVEYPSGFNVDRMAVIGPTSVAAALSSPFGTIDVTFGTVSGATTVWGTPHVSGLSSLSGQGSRLLTGGAGVVMYGSKSGVSDNNLWANEVGIGGAIPEYLNADPALRIRTPLSGVVPGPMAQAGAGLHLLMEEQLSTGGGYCTRAQSSGGVATFSNSETNPNLLSSGPYTSPESDSGGILVMTPAANQALLSYRLGTVWRGGVLGVFGNVNMAGNTKALTPSGTTGSVPGVAFTTVTKFIMVWSNGTNLQGAVCTVG